MFLVVIAAAWKQISYNFLFFLAGLQAIPRSLIEAAAIDGAGPLRRFWTIVRSEEHTSELQSLMRTSYAVFCLKKKTDTRPRHTPAELNCCIAGEHKPQAQTRLLI